MVKTADLALCEAAGDEACAACFPGISASDFRCRRQHLQAHLGAADRFIAPSEFLRRRYTEWGIPASRIIVVANGIDPVRPPGPRRRAAGEPRGAFAFFG